MAYYPVDEDGRGTLVKTSIRMSEQDLADISLIAELWTELDRSLGKRRREWKTASVVERLISVGIAGVWQQLGGRPESKGGREDFIKRAIQQLQAKPKK